MKTDVFCCIPKASVLFFDEIAIAAIYIVKVKQKILSVTAEYHFHRTFRMGVVVHKILFCNGVCIEKLFNTDNKKARQ
mgnify:FL=1